MLTILPLSHFFNNRPTAAVAYNGTPIARGVNFSVRAPNDPHAHGDEGHGPAAPRADAHQIPRWSTKTTVSSGSLLSRSNINGMFALHSLALSEFLSTVSFVVLLNCFRTALPTRSQPRFFSTSTRDLAEGTGAVPDFSSYRTTNTDSNKAFNCE